MLRTRPFGKTGFNVTEVSMGGIPIIGMEDKDEAASVVNYAIDKGMNYLDNARAYGNSEEKMGLVMKTRRDEVFLATKSHDRTYDGAWKHLETSLHDLQTDHLDLWQVHDVSTRDIWNEVMGPDGAFKAFAKARDEGIVKHIGITGHNDDTLCTAVESGEFESVLCVYNLAIHSSGKKLLPLCKERGVAICVMKPLSGGLFFRREELAIDPLRAWHFVLQNDCVSTGVAGANCLRDIDQAIAASESFSPLADEETAELVAKATALGDNVCRNCQYCRDCPQEIDVPKIMQMFDESRVFGYEWPRFRREYAALEPKADACVECNACLEACPFDLPVVERLQKFHAQFNQPV
jgi:predicted aldo/keto reductase-like oxidoreductase